MGRYRFVDVMLIVLLFVGAYVTNGAYSSHDSQSQIFNKILWVTQTLIATRKSKIKGFFLDASPFQPQANLRTKICLSECLILLPI